MTQTMGNRYLLQVYIENARDESLGGFTMPLPTMREALRPFLEGLEIENWRDMRIKGTFTSLSALRNEALAALFETQSPDTLNELNYLAAKLQGLSEWKQEVFHAALESGKHGSIAEVINIAENIESFDLWPSFQVVDYATERGYVAEQGDFARVYREPGDIPAEYRVFDFAEQSVTLTTTDCVEGGMKEDLRGKVVVIKPEALLPEYRVSAHQLVLVTGGFGCAPDARGRAVYGTNVYSGTSARWNREDILGVAAERVIPEWAREKREAKTPVAAMRMDKERFWEMIDEAREKAGCWQKMYEPLKESLSELGPSAALRWQQIFREYHDLSRKDGLWAAAAAMQGGCSDDSFDYFRGWLIAQGKETFVNALTDPDSLADLATMRAFAKEMSATKFTPPEGYYEEPRFEGMLHVGVEAYEERPGDYKFYRDAAKTPLSAREKAAIAGEIRYAADIDVRGSVLEKLREGRNSEQIPLKKPHKAGPEH